MVTMKSVATKPRRTRTKSLPCHQGSNRSSMAIEPFATRAFAGDAPVDREGPEQGQQHQDERGERREDAGRQRRDPRLVAEGGEVVDPGQTHDLPPGMLVVGVVGLVRPLRLLGLILQQPG